MCIHPCFEFAHCQLGERGKIKTRANKTRSTVSFHIFGCIPANSPYFGGRLTPDFDLKFMQNL